MIVINNSTFRMNLKKYFDACVTDNSLVVIKRNRNRNVVCMSIDYFNSICDEKITAEDLVKVINETKADSKQDA